ncbi:sigma-54-dependent Fis family transcriptional regulator [bacterium]|nr:sigma-54-dependent Fis family transcriptional regulator [bacterium]
MTTILIVDDDLSTRESLEFIFKKEGYSVILADDGKKAITILKESFVDIILTDLRMPDIDGFELLKIVKAMNINSSFILMTAYGTVENAVEILKEGADDFIIKPLKRALVIRSVEKALQKKALVMENELLKNRVKELTKESHIIGSSPSFRKILDNIDRVAQSNSTVLIFGESGTGKEVIAKEIHNRSIGAKNRFIAVNIAALPESIIESELFGYKKGAFTGAIQDRVGYLEASSNGTLFLDEISELPLSIQVKLLRFLQEGEVIPIGSTKPIKIKTRVVAASNKKIKNLISEGRFREDLFYRLNVIPIDLPPLRERVEDIPLLTAYFIKKHSIKSGKEILKITQETLDILKNYNWPGNVRELENLIERVVVFTDNIIEKKDLPSSFLNEADKISSSQYVDILIGSSMEEVESIMIQKTLQFTNGDKELAAKILGISVRTIYRKI